MIDLVAGAVVGLVGMTTAVAWAIARGARSTPIARVEQNGPSPLLGRGVQRVAYRALEPAGRALARWGVTADAVTVASVPLAAGAAAALAAGHLGVAALLGGAAYACDAIDGVVARATGTASPSGEVLDAVCDRLCEALMLGGLAVAWRSSIGLLVLVLAAEVGAQQVTLATAKAEAFPTARDRVPRGTMRRAERAVYFVGAAALGGVLSDLLPAHMAPSVARAPLAAAMALLAIVGNLSALARFAALARALRHEGVRDGGR